MKYMLLIYSNEQDWEDEEREAVLSSRPKLRMIWP